MSLPCKWDVQIGKFIEFMDNAKGMKTALFGIVVAILLQVGGFLFLWGGLVTTVKTHDKVLDIISTKLNNVKIVGYAIAGEKGEEGDTGAQGIQGEVGK